MTDPVNTHALRDVTRNEGLWEAEALLITAAAEEVERLRDRLHHVEHWTAPEAIRTWTKEHAENDRLRAVIENAPHSAICDSYEDKPCTCWKSRA